MCYWEWCVCACVHRKEMIKKNVSWTDLSQEIPGGLSVLISTRLAKTWTSKVTYSIRRELRESFSFVENETRSKRQCFMVEEFVVRWNRIVEDPILVNPLKYTGHTWCGYMIYPLTRDMGVAEKDQRWRCSPFKSPVHRDTSPWLAPSVKPSTSTSSYVSRRKKKTGRGEWRERKEDEWVRKRIKEVPQRKNIKRIRAFQRIFVNEITLSSPLEQQVSLV